MALLLCPDCGNQVSDLAQSCPKCGRPMKAVDPGAVKNPEAATLAKPSAAQSKLPFYRRPITARHIVSILILSGGMLWLIRGGESRKESTLHRAVDKVSASDVSQATTECTSDARPKGDT